MKNKLSKILGVFLTVALVAGTIAAALPVSAKNMDWEQILTPKNITGAGGMVNNRVNWVGPIARAINGDLYVAVGLGDDSETDTVEPNEVIIYKSTDFGRSWGTTGSQYFDQYDDWKNPTSPNDQWGDWEGVIFDILCSPISANTLWVTDGRDIWRSTDGGKNWSRLINLFIESNLAKSADQAKRPAGIIVSMDVGYSAYGNYLFVATSTFHHTVNVIDNAGVGGVYSIPAGLGDGEWDDKQIGSQRSEQLLGWYDVLEVKVLPDYAENQGIAAVVSDYYGQRSNVGHFRNNGTWDSHYSDAYVPVSSPLHNQSGPYIEHATPYVFNTLRVGTGTSAVDAANQARVITVAQDYTGSKVSNEFGNNDGRFDLQEVYVYRLAAGGTKEVLGSTVTGGLPVSVSYDATGTATITLSQGNWNTYKGQTLYIGFVYKSRISWTGIQKVTEKLDVAYGDTDFEAPKTVTTTYLDQNARTIVTTRFGNLQWGSYLGYKDVTLKFNLPGTGIANIDAILLNATIWIPDDFTDMSTLFVGVAPMPRAIKYAVPNTEGYATTGPVPYWETQGDVFRATFGNSASTAIDLDVSGYREIGVGATGLDGTGDSGNATMLVGGYQAVVYGEEGTTGLSETWATSDGGWTWVKNQKRPTGGISPIFHVPFVSVRVHADFATNGLAVAGTHGSAHDAQGWDANGDAGLSLSALPTDVCDKGFTWNTIYFISTRIDKKVDMSIANDGTIYMTTYGLFADPERQSTNDNNPPKLQLFSAWRYDGKYWERVNSYSLYPETEDPVRFDYVRTTPANSFVILVDGATKQFYSSTNRGNLWATPKNNLDISVNIYSVLLLGINNVLVGVGDGDVYYTRNLASWTVRSVFTSGKVTDLRLASNGDVIAAAPVTASGETTVRIARSIYGSTNQDYSTWASAVNTGIKAADWAFAAPATDYSTSNVVYAASDTSTTTHAINYRAYTSGTWLKADADTAWYNTTGAKGSYVDSDGETRYLSNLVTAPGGIGFEAEGVGMAYLNVVGNPAGVARIKGRIGTSAETRAAERINRPLNNQGNAIGLDGLWAGPASLGNVIIYTFGSDCNIYYFTDCLNTPIKGVNIPSVKLVIEECRLLCEDFFDVVAQWDELPCADYYLVVLYKGEQQVNYYDALDHVANGGGDLVAASIQKTTAATFYGLDSQTKYFVSVWGFTYTVKDDNLNTGTAAAKANKAIANSLSSFGDGVSFTTPPTTPKAITPSIGEGKVSIRPYFQWYPVSNATNYTLVVSASPDFSNPIKTVTTTATAYGWTASDPQLSYSTNYYWKVTANTPAGPSVGNLNGFTTESAPPPPQPTPTLSVTVTQPVVTLPQPSITVSVPPQPPVTVVVPQPTFSIPVITVVTPPVEPPSTPVYIWIIVAIGAILAIAVIVLIIRTRRVV